MNKKNLIFVLLLGLSMTLQSQQIQIGLLKYNGGGDWYANPTALPNLARFCNQELNTNFDIEYLEVAPGDIDLFNVPYVHMTGHGNVIFNETERQNLREYLFAGGFLHIDDNYGMDKYIRRELQKLFPDKKLIELPYAHPIYHQTFKFKSGLPKIHRHDGKAPQGFAILHKGRVLLFYSYESDLGDGWEDPSVHNDSPEKHREALQMGANIIEYALHN
ncbi:MAG TPA: DUF4159 domain-containing protein [Salinivirga sp.]|uniref:DUF4159 domain-containing protein n=1 Tax=Salinivirga sp. TaxID=1970192 RepID=UPI002B4870C6|nr:DUF4159 domain-containing protein [Salinivirga sp.]HKK59404.1 DUF4159 domain-containing protein [Salinivirga sp.]